MARRVGGNHRIHVAAGLGGAVSDASEVVVERDQDSDRATAQALADLAEVAIVQHRTTIDPRFRNAGLSQATASTIDKSVVALRDATDHDRRLRYQLAAVEARVSEALIAVDANGCVTQLNRAAEELLGLSAGAARGKRFRDVVRLEFPDGEDLTGQLRDATAHEWDSTALLTPRFGEAFPVSISAGPLGGADSDAPSAILVMRDLRGERDLERMKAEFLSHIGHELRTPLAGVIGFTELLSRGRLSHAESEPIFEHVLSSARRLERVIEMLEFVAASRGGQVVLTRENFDIRDVVRDVVQRYAASVSTHFFADRVPLSPAMANVDRGWLTRCVEELVDNAVKFSPDGARVDLTCAVDQRRGQVVVSVRDSGSGLASDVLEHAFNPFVQGDGSNTRSSGGFGLGLALVQRVAEAHGGSVLVESERNQGSVISVVLPAASAPQRLHAG